MGEKIADIKKGNSTAFKVLYNDYYRRLFYFAKEYVIDEDEAHNLVQDTFLQLWERKEFLNEDSNLKSLLFVITRNNCLNHLKHIKVRQKFIEKSQSTIIELGLNYQALEKLSLEHDTLKELEEIIANAILALPDRCAEIFKLSRFEGKSNKEIATILEITEKAVEAQITKALKKMREIVKANYPTDLTLFILPFLTEVTKG